MSVANPCDRMKVIISHLSAADNGGERESLYEELEELTEWCEDIDIACGMNCFSVF